MTCNILTDAAYVFLINVQLMTLYKSSYDKDGKNV